MYTIGYHFQSVGSLCQYRHFSEDAITVFVELDGFMQYYLHKRLL